MESASQPPAQRRIAGMGSARLSPSPYDLLNSLIWRKIGLTDISQALFNVMLRDFGVKGVKVQEVVSLDDEMMAFLEYMMPCHL